MCRMLKQAFKMQPIFRFAFLNNCYMFSTQSAYAKYVNEYYVKSFGVSTQSYNQKYLKETGNEDRLWWFQVCTEVAFFQIAPANDSIRSSKVDTKYV